MTTETDIPTTANQLVVMQAADAPIVTGRRSYLEWRDLGIRGATNGWMRAERVISTQALEKPTGWHYHPCEAHWLFVMSGWIQVAFEDGSQHRLGAGGSMFIPGGYRHNEIASSADFDLLEMSIPAQLETVPCDPPDGLSADVVSIF